MRASHLRIALTLSAALLGGAAPRQQPRSAAGATDWSAASREDIDQAYRIFTRHHPGMYDPNNPRFAERLRHARDDALAFARKVRDEEGHMRAVSRFSAGLADGHASVVVGWSGHGPLLWPGFTAVWRGHALYVQQGERNGPSRGSILLACDGRNARDLIRQQVFLNGRAAEEGQWWVNAPMFFWRRHSPYERLPRECRFRTPAGYTTSYALKWREASEQTIERWAGQWKRAPIGLTEPRSGLYWVTLSTFSPDNDGRAAYERLFSDLDANLPRIAAGRAIVIDLRNNTGGSSAWSGEIAAKLWGEAAVTARLARYFRNTQIWWLADATNASHWRETAARLAAEHRPTTDEEIDLAELASKLEAALKRGEHFYVEDYGALLARRATKAEPRRLPPIYVIIDGGCASACLDALDLFTRFPGVKLVGAPTSADSQYLDVRLQPLPSGRGGVWLPTKIWVHRPRRAGEIYRPEIPVNDLDWTTARLLDHIERDLAARKPT